MSVSSSSSDLPYADDDDDKPYWPVRASSTSGQSVKLTQFTQSNSVDGGMYQCSYPVCRISQYTTVYSVYHSKL